MAIKAEHEDTHTPGGKVDIAHEYIPGTSFETMSVDQPFIFSMNRRFYCTYLRFNYGAGKRAARDGAEGFDARWGESCGDSSSRRSSSAQRRNSNHQPIYYPHRPQQLLVTAPYWLHLTATAAQQQHQQHQQRQCSALTMKIPGLATAIFSHYQGSRSVRDTSCLLASSEHRGTEGEKA